MIEVTPEQWADILSTYRGHFVESDNGNAIKFLCNGICISRVEGYRKGGKKYYLLKVLPENLPKYRGYTL